MSKSTSKNSIAILLGYLVIFVLPTVLNQLFSLKSIIYPAMTADYALGAILLVWLNYYFSTKNSISGHSNWTQIILWGFLGFILTLIIQSVIQTIYYSLLKTTVPSQNTSEIMTIVTKYPYYMLAISFGAPIMEELVFRKVFFGNLASFIPPMFAAIISSLLFSLAHNDGHLAIYFLIGLLFCYLYKRTGSIKTSMIAHILMNSFVLIIQVSL
ncbi:CPBP family intramembrane glutamic endopeptidase [Dellaglioa sp. BT-FLS60]